MKCPHCQSHMYVLEQSQTELSHVTFYRCTVCVGEHVTSQLILDNQPDNNQPLTQQATQRAATQH